MIGDSKSNLKEIQKAFRDAIQEIRETDSTGKLSSILAQRATIVFSDGSLLYITEILTKQERIELYHYDWIASDRITVLGKYHSEPHEDENYQTDTEPYHVHSPKHPTLNTERRYPNHSHTDLFSIVEGIFFFHLMPQRK
ncbi:toxin-antitoxin system TumE family protein [Paenibacillus sp. MMS18-CY102]|uniref:toxin-antitoxin system TumE family protein n=1 Tax=Paenibacillus sp. MMS18-CY102 TaxID=2682849 RepID=UPI001365AE0E|nr:DUF6516 family protein [Paenibacillus sp. MMS18-CY102]MWC30140.1 hypothetical protein [Paenibacillus sp. MMS18-CY102]